MNEKEAIVEASQQLKNGAVILCPTDTIWGLSCDATNEEAVQKIIQLKNRPTEKGFIVLVNSDRMINQCVRDLPEVVWDLIDLAEKPLSIVLEGGQYIAKNALHKSGTIAIRMVKSGICFDLLRRFNKPIISTSPNISGEPTPYSFADIQDGIINQVDYIFPKNLVPVPSTILSKIISIRPNGEVKVLRK